MTTPVLEATALAGLDSIAVMADDDELRSCGLSPEQIELIRNAMASDWPVQLQLHIACAFGLSN